MKTKLAKKSAKKAPASKVKKAPAGVAKLRDGVRKQFKRGVNETADEIFDGLIVWIVDDLITGRMKTREDASETIGWWLARAFPIGKKQRPCVA